MTRAYTKNSSQKQTLGQPPTALIQNAPSPAPNRAPTTHPPTSTQDPAISIPPPTGLPEYLAQGTDESENAIPAWVLIPAMLRTASYSLRARSFSIYSICLDPAVAV